MRIILFAVGIIIILFIVFDGFRRQRRQVKEQTRSQKAAYAEANQKLQEEKKIHRLVEIVEGEEKTLAEEKGQLSLFEHRAPTFNSDLPSPTFQTSQEIVKEKSPITGLLTLSVIAPDDQPISGQSLLQALLRAGCRFGKYRIFHRHVCLDGKGPIYFSVASIVQPGYFDMNTIHTITTPGIVLFMEVNVHQNAKLIFQLMLDTAKQLAQQWGATVCDDKREPLSEERIEAYRKVVEP